MLKRIAGELQDIVQMGVQVAVVIGGGNIFRGAGLARAGMDRVTADHMGMLATVMNALAMQDALESLGLHARVMSAIRINEVCEDYIRRRAVRHLEKGRVVIFAAGTGNPFFTTDTAASLRAIEINADVLLKATKVNGVYSDDPVRNPAAVRYAQLTFDKVLHGQLNVMDATAIVMCRDNRLPLRVFNLNNSGDLTRIVQRRRDRYAGRRMLESGERTMLEDLKKDAASRMAKCVQTVPGRSEEAAHRPCASEPDRASEGRLLRLGCAAAAGGQHRGRGRAHARGLPVGEDHGAADREGDPQIRLGLTPDDRRHGDPHSDAAADRGAPARHHQGAAPGRRECARRRAQRAPGCDVAISRKLLKEKLISQDDERRAETEVQKLTDKHVADIDQLLAAKEKEIMQV